MNHPEISYLNATQYFDKLVQAAEAHRLYRACERKNESWVELVRRKILPQKYHRAIQVELSALRNITN